MTNQASRFWISALIVVFAGLQACAPGLTVIDGPTVAKARALEDPELASDARRLEGKDVDTQSGEFYGAQCLKAYIEARHSEQARAGAANEAAVTNTTHSNYMVCANSCELALSLDASSEYGELAAKYLPRCKQGVASLQARQVIEVITKLVASFKQAKAPLELFLADLDCQKALEIVRSAHLEDARVAQLSAEIAQLSTQHAAAIRKGKAFFEGAEARSNFAQRAALEAERSAIESDIQATERHQDKLMRDGSLGGYSEKRRLDDELRAQQPRLAHIAEELERLQEEYKRLAIKRGVLAADR